MGNHQKKLLDILQKLEYHTPHKCQAASMQPVLLGCRSTVGLPTLDRPIGVRIPAPQPWRGYTYPSVFLFSPHRHPRTMRKKKRLTPLNLEQTLFIPKIMSLLTL